MTGSTASVSISIAQPGITGAPPSLSVNSPRATANGPPSLAAFTEMMAGRSPRPADEKAAADGQDDAATGNSLPDADDDKVDPALAWLFSAAPILLPTPTPTPTSTPAPKPVTVTIPQSAETLAALAAADLTGQTTAPANDQAPKAASDQALADPVPADPASIEPTPRAAPKAPPMAFTLPSAQALAAAALRPAPASAVAAAVAKASANTLQPALFALAMERDRPGDDDSANPFSSTGGAASLIQPADVVSIVTKAGDAQGQTLDMSRQDWPQKMIDRIETLRDNANANDTSIRLKPEALGRIDISLRSHTDGAVSVRFTAEQPTTRSLIADAQPQLRAAAEARGIRLSGTSVDLGGSGMTGGDRPQPRFELQQNITNTLAAGGEDITAVDDGRIA